MTITSATKFNASKEVPYYLPEPAVAPGTLYGPETKDTPVLFRTLKIRGLTLPNRIGVSPMVQYSGDKNFEPTPYHHAHYGLFLTRGPGVTIVEATSVSPEGPASPGDLGLWNESQALKLKPIVDFAHGHKQLIGVQLNHAGRKASTVPNFVHLEQIADEAAGGWPNDVVAPSPVAYRPGGTLVVPRELTISEIDRIIDDFGDAARRAVEVSGFDFVEIHGAHGYLINEFLSSTSNLRTDKYGGLFENRTRFLLQVIDNVRRKISAEVPIFVRVSASENSPDANAWQIADTIKLAHIVVDRGVDVIDVSSGGNNYRQAARASGNDKRQPLHEHLARAIKKSLGDKALVACVGQLDDAHQVNAAIEQGGYDIALVGRGFLRNPGLVWTWADVLGVRLHQTLQYGWGFYPNRQQIAELVEKTAAL